MDSSINALKKEKRLLLEKYLKENMPRYETIFMENEDAIYALDLDGHFMKVNPACERILGIQADNLAEMTFQKLVPVDDLHRVFQNFHDAFEGKIQNNDYKITKNSGDQVFLNVTSLPIIVNNEVVGIYGVARDITAIKKKNAKNRKEQDIHRLLTENSLDIIVRTDLDGNFLYLSPSCEHILGYTPEELLNQNKFSYVHYHDKKRVMKNRSDVISKGENGRTTFRMRKKNGNYVWVESLFKLIRDPKTDEVTEVISVIRDITERKLSEDDVKKREETYRNLVENAPDAAILAAGNEILFINDTGVNLLGACTKEVILQKSLLDIIHPDYHDIASKRMNLEEDGEDFIEYRLIRLDGSEVDVEMKGITTIYRNNPVKHIIIRDITERKKTQELLLHSEKLSVAGQLAAGIAHEVRNPLTAIKGFLQLMQSELKTHSNYFNIIESEMDRIEIILSELLVLAKPQDLKFEIKELAVMIEHVKALIDTHAIMKNIVISTNYDCDNLKIKCDENQLKQVFINLLKNSIEAMPDGGNITIELKEHGQDKVKMLFKDTGFGIPKELLKKIGQPFFTTKENGTGLGFMISKQIIENHHGTIHIWSDSKGTIIEIILPLN
ncbi:MULTISPECIES: PAS domain-containing sensor histidine kinase [Heyndrickxia]|uniref:PAS domain-containing sensor histidine kinase n=1 Tax=Heyndrickxia TaxID=2837504 RepID=UPI0006EBF2DC|nr:PAS domain-containing sensor histidine kinase [Heyndrickxia shackletonii]MBB2480363.1 PAS domain S-box protein [Bacillus sp. APMAM]NEZ02499.1 PAS domain S-box protein [Heyndrickxia shackletonii]RTZ56252.1 PAS domain-containing sensor histidine kinase [Bacillus sp. SAJ1]